MAFLGLGLSMRTLNTWDESWFLQVVLRMREGDVLYRDIAYGAGPFPAYLTEAVTYLVGIDVLAEKLVFALTFAGTATLSWAVAGRLGLDTKGRLLVLGAIAYFSPPLQEAPYAPLATMLTAAALLSVLVFQAADTTATRRNACLAGGASCGLAFVCKQNIGVYALVAFAIVVLLERHLRDALFAVASAATTATLVLLPVVLSGGLSRYIDYGFTGKGTYVDHPLSFLAGLDGILQTIRDIHSPASAEAAYWGGRFFLPFLAAAGLLLLLWTRQRRTPSERALIVFAVVAGATLFPRFDPGHVAYAAPPLVLLLAYVIHQRRTHVPRAGWLALTLWLSLSLAIMATLPLRLAHSAEANLSDLPHFHGAFLQPQQEAVWRRQAAQLVSAAHGDSDGLLLLVPDAGFRYLASGLRNPTAFDFPFVTTFGKNGQQRVIDALAAGRIKRVCVARDWFGLEPTKLVGYIRANLHAGSELGFCTVYSLR